MFVCLLHVCMSVAGGFTEATTNENGNAAPANAGHAETAAAAARTRRTSPAAAAGGLCVLPVWA